MGLWIDDVMFSWHEEDRESTGELEKQERSEFPMGSSLPLGCFFLLAFVTTAS